MTYPTLVTLPDFGGDYDKFIDAVYDTYRTQLVDGNLSFLGKPVRFKHLPATDGRGFAFWHAVQEGTESGKEEDRQIDPRRCERIGWPAHMLSSITADGSKGDVLWWRTQRGTRTRIVLWMPTEHYALILEERQHVCMFWTTYMVRRGRERSFAAEHARYWNLDAA